MNSKMEVIMKSPYEIFSRAIGSAIEDFRQGYDQLPIGPGTNDESCLEHDDRCDSIPDGCWSYSDGGRFHA